MRRTTLRIAAAAIGSAMVLGASATAASAAPATFSTTGPLSAGLMGSLVFKIGTTPTPATTVTCTKPSFWPAGTAANMGVPAQGRVTGFQLPVLSCVSGTGQNASVIHWGGAGPMLATKTGSAYSLSGTDAWYMQIVVSTNWWDSNPNGGPVSYSASWTNYPAPGNSLLVFNNAPVGRIAPGPGVFQAGQPITVTGTFQVKTQAGGPITLI